MISLRSLITEVFPLSSEMTPDGGAPALSGGIPALYWFVVAVAVAARDPPYAMPAGLFKIAFLSSMQGPLEGVVG